MNDKTKTNRNSQKGQGKVKLEGGGQKKFAVRYIHKRKSKRRSANGQAMATENNLSHLSGHLSHLRKFKSKIAYTEGLPDDSNIKTPGESALLIYDLMLDKYDFWLRWKSKFQNCYGVKAGESLKDLRYFYQHMTKINRLAGNLPRLHGVIIGAGGGTIGDFAGFVASVFKRGVKLIHLPTTWLAALDSAHGGKTALNLNGKNQVGTFWPAQKIFICRDFLTGQPENNLREAYCELIKMACINGGPWAKKLMNTDLGQRELSDLLWEILPQAVAAKYRIIRKDPFELSGIRQLLNLGHTFGHVLETHYQWSHGYSVGQGLFFSARWSHKRNLLSTKIKSLIENRLGQLGVEYPVQVSPISIVQIKKLLMADKKMGEHNKIQFVFLKDIGEPFCEMVSISEILQEALRQGWTKARGVHK